MRHSLKWRLVLTFLLLALAVSAVFLFGMKRVVQTGWEGYARPMVADYVDKLADEIGSPPDVTRAQAIVARLPVTVRIDGPAVHFDSHPNLHRSWSYDDGDPRHGPESWGLVRTTADGHRIVFGLTGPLHRASQARTFALGHAGRAARAHVGGLRLCAPHAAASAPHRRRRCALRRRRLHETDRRDPQRRVGRPAERINRMANSLQGMLDAKRALLLAISHELRSPLTRARVNAELVGEGEHRDALLRDLSEMRDLISDLLEGERLTTGHSGVAHRERRISRPWCARWWPRSLPMPR